MDTNKMTTLNNIVRIGNVSSVDEGKRTARVTFADKSGLVSGPLKIIQCAPFIPQKGATQETEENEGHKHEITISPWLPEVGQLVLCIYLPNGESDGFVVGGV